MMHKNIEILEMKAHHISDVARLEEECFTEPWSYKSLEEELNNPNAYFIVAEIDGEVAGYCGSHIILDEGYITNIAVFKKFRGMKISKMLLYELFKYGEKSNFSFLSLEVRISNDIAISLYKSLGFVKSGLRKDFYNYPKEDALIMTKYFKET